jgi:uncharacterized protein (TIGR02757 family)
MVYLYEKEQDREVFALLSAAFAVGRVSSILSFLDRLRFCFPYPEAPAVSLRESSVELLRERFGTLSYRFYNGDSIVQLLAGIGGLLRRYGSLKDAFLDNERSAYSGDLHGLLTKFTGKLHRTAGECIKNDLNVRTVLPDPGAGSACKRLYLYLRWMVRRDEIDPGCWHGAVDPASLLVPLDTHMLNAGVRLGFTARKSGDLKTAREITKALKEFAFEDPVRYDFSMTRIGILGERVQWPA